MNPKMEGGLGGMKERKPKEEKYKIQKNKFENLLILDEIDAHIGGTYVP